MKLQLGQPVNATDGHFGVLSDVVIDPQQRTVSHVVAAPESDRLQSRLIPLWLVEEHDDELVVNLDLKHLRQLQRATFTDFVTPDSDITLDDSWGVGVEDVVSLPYWEAVKHNLSFPAESVHSYDRIPKGECEIRRRSKVFSLNGYMLGHVDGFLADREDLTGVVVRWGPQRFSHDVLVPIEAVKFVENDCIGLSIDRFEFHDLPSTEEFTSADDQRSARGRIESGASAISRRALTKLRPLSLAMRAPRRSKRRTSGAPETRSASG